MAQRIKKQLFRILPVSVVGLMVFALVIGMWQGQQAKNAYAVATGVAIVAPVTGSAINASANFVYDITGGAATDAEVTFTWVSGSADTQGTHIYVLSGAQLNAGSGKSIPIAMLNADVVSFALTNGLVDGAVYDVDFDAESGVVTATSQTGILYDTTAPTVTVGCISVTGANGTAGAFKFGNTPTLRWNNSNPGAGCTDNNTDIASVSFNAVNFKAGDTALVGGNAGNIWTASLSGALDSQDDTNNNITVTATDAAGNFTTVSGTNNYIIDTIVPIFATSGLTISTDLGVPSVAAVNGGIVAADAVKVNATVTAPDTDTITWNASPLGGGASATEANNTPVTVAAGAIDNAAYAFSVTATDDAGNTVTATTGAIDATTISLDNILPIIGAPGTISLTDVGGDGIASINDIITYAAGTLGGAPDGDVWTVDLSAYGILTTAVGPHTVVADNDNNVAFSANETVTDDAGNTQVGAPTAATIVGFTNIDNVAPTINADIHIASDNALDITKAKPGDTVSLTFTSTEPITTPNVYFWSGGNAATNAPTPSDMGGGTSWQVSYVVDPADTNGAVTFSIDYTDVALNAGATETLVDDASSVTVDVTAPGLARITTKTQSGAFPSAHDSVLWYNYTGDTFEAYVQGDEPLSEVRVCVRSLKEVGAFTQTCDASDFNNHTDYISQAAVGNAATFTGTTFAAIAGANPLVDMSGYSMNFEIIDAAGNVYATGFPSEAFVMVWNVDPLTMPGSILGGTTTDWTAIDDFTSVTGLTFQAMSGLTVLGTLSFPGSVDLTDPVTVTALQSFSSNVVVGGGDGSGDAVMGINSTALAALNVPASLSIMVPSFTHPGIVVYNNLGAVIGEIPNNAIGPVIIGVDTIDTIAWVAPYLTFTTTGFSGFGTDSTAPTVSTFSPANGATGVATTAPVVITFSEPMDTSTFAYTLTGSTGIVWSVNDTVATIAHTAFSNSTPYTLTLTVATDKVGNAISGPSSATFTTVAVLSGGGYGGGTPVDNTLPVATSISIAGGAAQTVSKEVVLALSATNAAQMMISNSSDFSGAVWETYATSKTWTLTDNYGTKTVYAKFKNSTGSISSVISDAIDYVATLTIPENEPANLVLTDPTPAPALPPQVTIGTLVKLANSDSVYFIDQDNRRHAFPNTAVYSSYYPDFSGIQTISSTIMAEIPLGSNVTMRPGTYLVKIQSDPKVYAVAPYGVLKGLGSETIAASLYGADWATRVIDVESTFFINYQIGSAITTATLPTGSAFSYLGDTKVYYVDGGNKRYISSAVFSNNKFQNKFVIRNLATANTYPDGVDLPSQGMEVIMTLR